MFFHWISDCSRKTTKILPSFSIALDSLIPRHKTRFECLFRFGEFLLQNTLFRYFLARWNLLIDFLFFFTFFSVFLRSFFFLLFQVQEVLFKAISTVFQLFLELSKTQEQVLMEVELQMGSNKASAVFRENLIF